jgi:5-methylcytosine-specific restriction endonuclease McrA
MPKGDSLPCRQSLATKHLSSTKGVKLKIYLKQLRRKAKKTSLKIKLSSMSDKDVAVYIKTSSGGFLLSDAWRALRIQAIEKYGFICLCCGKENSRQHPINIDHIKPRKFYPELALNIENLQPLCGTCNKRKGNKTISYRK